jgi:hypothetical protein
MHVWNGAYVKKEFFLVVPYQEDIFGLPAGKCNPYLI